MGELDGIQRRFRDMEAKHRLSNDDSIQTIRMQRTKIEKLKDDNERLKEELALESRWSHHRLPCSIFSITMRWSLYFKAIFFIINKEAIKPVHSTSNISIFFLICNNYSTMSNHRAGICQSLSHILDDILISDGSLNYLIMIILLSSFWHPQLEKQITI